MPGAVRQTFRECRPPGLNVQNRAGGSRGCRATLLALVSYSQPTNYCARKRANAIHVAVAPAVVRMNCVAIRNSPPQTVAACGRPRVMTS